MRSPLVPKCPDFELELWKYRTWILMDKYMVCDTLELKNRAEH